MKKAIFYLSALLIVTCVTQPASAQFEGKIMFTSTEYSSEGTALENDQFSIFITPDRILLQGDEKYDFMGSIETEGLLVRLDFEDFVFLTGDQEVLKISKSDITSMMNMFGDSGSSSGAADKAEGISYERTNESETIKGYKCDKFIFREEDVDDHHTEIWMTKDIQVNWGMLAEPWSGETDAVINSLPTDLVFQENYFPIKVEMFRNNKLVSKVEATQINESSVARAMVQIPSGVQVLSFQDFLFQKMSEQ